MNIENLFSYFSLRLRKQRKHKETAVSVLKGDKMTTIPKELQKIHEDVSKLLIDYCEKYLDKEYEELCLHALDKLCCRRPSPMKRGRANTWTAGIIYAIGSNNFIFDKTQPIHMSVDELIAPLGVARSTAANKSLIIRKMLKIDFYVLEWTLPTSIANNTMIWMVSMNGLTYDARRLPVRLQEEFFKQGKIPYVPAHKKLEAKTKQKEATKETKESGEIKESKETKETGDIKESKEIKEIRETEAKDEANELNKMEELQN